MINRKPSPAAFITCVLFFGWVLYVVFCLNGSCIGAWSSILGDAKTQDSLLAGTPRQIRSDEWLVWTPAIIAQGNHQPAWPVANPTLGAGNSPLIMSLPAWHSSMLVRPQLWGFFVFGLEYGFSWYWGAKIFALFGGMFALFWWLTKKNWALAIGGSLWVFLSGYIQWWFSCPPMLPEMLASWGFALASLFLISTTQRTNIRVMAAIGCAMAAANFVLCCYPPFQIPLVYLGLVIFLAWRWEMPADSLASPRAFWTGAGIALALFVAVIWKWYLDVAETLQLVAGTSYPGSREVAGGSLEIRYLFSGIMNFGITETNCPKGFGSVCDIAHFQPLWLPAAVASLPILFKKRAWVLPASILGVILILCIYCIAGLPLWMAKLSLLARTTEIRSQLALGFAGVVFTIVVLSRVQRQEVEKHWKWIAGVTGFAIFALIMRQFWIAGPEYFTASHWVILIICNGTLLVLLALWQERLLLVALTLTLTPWTLSVNPLNVGLSPLTEATPLPILRKLAAADPNARWVAYSSSHLSSFLGAAGFPTMSGSKTVPDMDFYKILDPTQASRIIYNRYSITTYELPQSPDETTFEQINFCTHRNCIAPLHPLLQKLNVRFIVCPLPLKFPAKYGLKAILAMPKHGIFVYRTIAGEAAVAPEVLPIKPGS